MRTTLKSLSDCTRVMQRYLQMAEKGEISETRLQALSQHVKRASDIIAKGRELDVEEELLAIEERLARVAER
jgi:hypothetical protein